MMCHFYNQYFPEGMHKISPEELKKVAETLEKAYSDDVLNLIFLTMIEEEDRSPTFKHPDNWTTLTIEEKGDIMAIVLQLKIISVADFSSHYFKEVSSLSKSVEENLNRDTRLDINKATEQRPELEQVLQEIARNRYRNNKHQNDQEDSFKQKSKDDFPLLGLVTNRPKSGKSSLDFCLNESSWSFWCLLFLDLVFAISFRTLSSSGRCSVVLLTS